MNEYEVKLEGFETEVWYGEAINAEDAARQVVAEILGDDPPGPVCLLVGDDEQPFTVTTSVSIAATATTNDWTWIGSMPKWFS